MAQDIPADMQKAIAQLKRTRSREACLRKAYDIITKRFRGWKFGALIFFYQHLIYDPVRLWRLPGIMICTAQNRIMRDLLLRSGKFSKEDIEFRWTLVWYISLHQYLRVRVSDKKRIFVDLWGNANGVKFGSYARGFKT